MSFFEKGDFLNNPIECFYYDSNINISPVKPHFHYYMEILLMTDGCATIQENNNELTLKSGEMILFHPNSVHAIFPANNNHMSFEGFKVDINRMNITSDYSPKLRSIYKSIEKKSLVCHYSSEFCTGIKAREIFDNCIKESREKKYGYDLVIKSEIYNLLIKILRHHQSEGFVIESETYAEDGRYDIFCITDYIDNHLNENVKVNDIAKACGMSYSYFAKKFLLVYGKSCKEYIEDMRVYKAEELLMFTNFDLTYISNECGYADCSHLINSFKKINHVTPKQFRKLHSGTDSKTSKQ